MLFVNRISIQHFILRDQAAPAFGEEHVVTELDRRLHLAALDEVGMGFENRIELLGSWNLLAVEHTAARLIDHTGSQTTKVLDLLARFRDHHVGDHISAMRLAGIPQHHACALQNLLGNADELTIFPGLLLLTLPRGHPLDLQHPTPCRSCSIPEPLDTPASQRLVGRLAEALGRRRIKGFPDRTRSARRRMLEIQRMTTRQRQERQTGTYRELIGIAEEVLQSARMVLRNTRKTHGRDMIADMVIAETRKEIEHFCSLGARVIDQSRRRVLNGEQVPTAEKLYSIFEPHTDLIKRGKVQTPIEFGHHVFLAESGRGLITQYEVLDGNPVDEQHVIASLKSHKQAFGHAPHLYGGDRGFFSEHNVASCKQDGVKVVCIPQRGGTKTPEREAYEKSREFKDGQRFRAGIEGRISVLFRGRGMKRCLAEGRERFELWVAAAVLANNLMKIADLLMQRSSRERKTA